MSRLYHVLNKEYQLIAPQVETIVLHHKYIVQHSSVVRRNNAGSIDNSISINSLVSFKKP